MNKPKGLQQGEHITFAQLETAIQMCADWGIPAFVMPYAHGTRLVVLMHFDSVYVH